MQYIVDNKKELSSLIYLQHCNGEIVDPTFPLVVEILPPSATERCNTFSKVSEDKVESPRDFSYYLTHTLIELIDCDHLKNVAIKNLQLLILVNRTYGMHDIVDFAHITLLETLVETMKGGLGAYYKEYQVSQDRIVVICGEIGDNTRWQHYDEDTMETAERSLEYLTQYYIDNPLTV